MAPLLTFLQIIFLNCIHVVLKQPVDAQYYCAILNIQYYWILLNIIEYYWILLNIIEYYWILLNIIEYYWILLNIQYCTIISTVYRPLNGNPSCPPYLRVPLRWLRVCCYPHHFCLTLVWRRQERARATERETGRYETDDVLMFCLVPSFGRRDTPSFACATGVRDGRKHIRWAREPVCKMLTQARLKSFLHPRRSWQIALFIIIHSFEIIYDVILQNQATARA